ncbi:hypothetical protein C7I55_21720 [Sphingomonas deserti]|uniref:Uncharacterized protein n=1 Tax=Allosphingosinicella deserti TaxID=2116704 RepID=A0A2P7QI88_9SPHN|nr:hypothetical protein C7I55_21720 [Sphingomonas deserti]
MPQHVIVRAFDLARSGSCASLPALRAQLRLERYANNEVEPHLAGPLIQRQLKKLIEEANGQSSLGHPA